MYCRRPIVTEGERLCDLAITEDIIVVIYGPFFMDINVIYIYTFNMCNIPNYLLYIIYRFLPFVLCLTVL